MSAIAELGKLIQKVLKGTPPEAVSDKELIKEALKKVKETKVEEQLKNIGASVKSEPKLIIKEEQLPQNIDKIDFTKYISKEDLNSPEKVNNFLSQIQAVKESLKNVKTKTSETLFTKLVELEHYIRKNAQHIQKKSQTLKGYVEDLSKDFKPEILLKTTQGKIIIDQLAKKFNVPKKKIQEALEWGMKHHPNRVAIIGATGLSLPVATQIIKDFFSSKTQEDTPENYKPVTSIEDINTGGGKEKVSVETTKEKTKPIELDLTPLQKEREIIKQKQQNLLNLATKYKEIEELHKKSTEKYTDTLTKVLPATMLFMSKTVLNTLADEDLPVKIKEAIENLPATALDKGIHKVILGYTVARANGMNTNNLSMLDLMSLSENPDLAVNVPQEVLNTANVFGNFVGNIYKAKIGHYKYLQDILDAQKQSLAVDLSAEYEVYKTILDELKYKYDIQKTEKSYELEKEKVEILKDKSNSGGLNFNLESIREQAY